MFSHAVSKRRGNKSRITIPLFGDNSVSYFNGIVSLLCCQAIVVVLKKVVLFQYKKLQARGSFC